MTCLNTPSTDAISSPKKRKYLFSTNIKLFTVVNTYVMI